MKRARWYAPAVAMMAAMLVASAAHAQVMQQVPGDAVMVIKVRNLQDVSNKMAALSQKFGLAAMNPAMANPLQSFQQMSGVQQGLNANGDMAFFFLAPAGGAPAAKPAAPAAAEGEAEAEADGDEQELQMVALIPVSDYKAFLANFKAPAAEGADEAAAAKPVAPGPDGIAEVQFPNNEQPSFVAQWGGYAAVSDNRQHLAKKPQGGLKAQGLAAKELESKDIVLFGNMPAVRNRALPKLKAQRAELLAQMDAKLQEEGKVDPKYQPIAKAAANQALNVAEQFLTDAQGGTYGLSFNEAGITSTAVAEFNPGSKFGGYLSKLKGTNESLVKGLPGSAKYIAFGGFQIDPQVATQVLNDLIGPVEKELATLGPEAKSIQAYLAALRTYIGASQSSSFGMVAPTGQIGQDALLQAVSVTNGDAAKIVESQRQMVEASEELTQMFAGGGVTAKTTHQPKAKTVDGVALDMFQTQFATGDAENPQAAQMQQMMTMFYGPNGMTAYTGMIDAKRVVNVAGAPEALMTSAIQAAKKGDDTLTQQGPVAEVRKQLPQNRIAAVYVPVDVLANTGITYAQQFGFPIKAQLPANLPPLGFTAATEGNAIRFDGYVPAQLVESLVSTSMQAFMQMQQGGQPGGPGGL